MRPATLEFERTRLRSDYGRTIPRLMLSKIRHLQSMTNGEDKKPRAI